MKPGLTLVAIAKNEAALIARMLKSVSPHVDDMVVLDTGSTDRTMTIARGMGARVYEYEWADDFAAARNEAMKHVETEWCISLDCDEVLSSENIDMLAIIPKLIFYDGVNIMIQDKSSSGPAIRIYRSNQRWEGVIHEQPMPHPNAVTNLPLAVVHMPVEGEGYNEGKIDRNVTLLSRALDKDENNGYLHYCIGNEYARMNPEDHPEHLTDALRHYKLSITVPSTTLGTWRLAALRQCAYMLERIGGHRNEALTLCRNLVDAHPEYPDAHYLMGQLWASSGNLPAARSCFKNAEHLGKEEFTGAPSWGQIDRKAKVGLQQVNNLLGITPTGKKAGRKLKTR